MFRVVPNSLPPGLYTVPPNSSLAENASALRELAQTSGLIFLPPSTHIELNGTQVEVPAGANVRIITAEHSQATLSGEGSSRLFEVKQGGRLELVRIHLMDGFEKLDSNGGGTDHGWGKLRVADWRNTSEGAD